MLPGERFPINYEQLGIKKEDLPTTNTSHLERYRREKKEALVRALKDAYPDGINAPSLAKILNRRFGSHLSAKQVTQSIGGINTYSVIETRRPGGPKLWYIDPAETEKKETV